MKGRFLFACDRKQDEQDHQACWWCRSLARVLHKMDANMKYLLYFIFIWVNLFSMRGFANCKILKTIICFIDNTVLFLPDNVRFLNALTFFFSFAKSYWKIYFGASLTTLTEKIKLVLFCEMLRPGDLLNATRYDLFLMLLFLLFWPFLIPQRHVFCNLCSFFLISCFTT